MGGRGGIEGGATGLGGTYEAEEEYEEEEVDEEAQKKLEEQAAKKAEEKKDGDDDAKEEPPPVPMKKVKKTRTVQKVKKTKTIAPKEYLLATLLTKRVGEDDAKDTQELCAAADAVDEFLKRECAAKIAATLRVRKEEHKLHVAKQNENQ